MAGAQDISYDSQLEQDACPLQEEVKRLRVLADRAAGVTKDRVAAREALALARQLTQLDATPEQVTSRQSMMTSAVRLSIGSRDPPSTNHMHGSYAKALYESISYLSRQHQSGDALHNPRGLMPAISECYIHCSAP